MDVYTLSPGTAPLLISMPHVGTALPDDVAAAMRPSAMSVPDTDWHLDRLYDFAAELQASVLQPAYSRYLIDLNRPADGSNLYPGADSTGLCPISSFASESLYRHGCEPDAAEIQRRLTHYWQPYHQALQQELARLHTNHAVVVLFEAHSIRSRVPRLFEGRLPEFNIGTASGSSCDPELQHIAESVLADNHNYALAVNQRFKGGYITRAYGRPENGVHAIQLELSQLTYMQEEPPFTYLPELAAQVQPVLAQLLRGLLAWATRK